MLSQKFKEEETCPIQECNITSINNFIECPFCAFKACLKCNQHFILNSETTQCMSCKKIWNDDFIDTTFPKTFRKNNLKISKENIMYKAQEALFPETIEFVSRKKKVEKIQDKINNLKLKIDKYNREIYEITNVDTKENEEKEEKKTLIIRKCPESSCRGYLNKSNICGICDIIVCPKCENIKDNDEHKCNEDDIKTVELKYKTCKPCPNCNVMTFRDKGCFQVFCAPPCNSGKGTAWNFNTGEVDIGPIHSPDYYDWMRKNNNGIVPRQQENLCIRRDEIPQIWDLQKRLEYNDFIKLTNIHRFFVDLRNNVMNKFMHIEQAIFRMHLDLRILYLNNEIDKDKFKKTLFARNKKDNKNKTIHQNLFMLYNVGVDIFNQLKFQPVIDIKTNLIETKGVYESLENIRKYYNNVIKKTKERYDCTSLSVSELTPTWKFKY